MDNCAALAAGLTLRHTEATARDVLASDVLAAEAPGVAGGMARAREAELLDMWRTK
jgi:hypothetical protein